MSNSLEEQLDTLGKLEEYFKHHTEKTVVVFLDLANSTLYKRQRPFLMGLNRTRTHNRLVTEVMTAHGGVVVKYMGDGVLVRFDLGNEEHQSYRAVNAAIAVQEQLETINGGITDSLERIETRIGMAVGVVADFYGNDPQGEVVDLAARIQAIAKPGQILVQASMLDSMNLGKITSALGSVRKWKGREYIGETARVKLKGFAEPQDVVEVRWGDDFKGIKTEDEFDEYWENYRYDATLFPFEGDKAIASEYFRIVFEIRYETVLKRKQFIFACVRSIEELGRAMRNAGLFARYMLPNRPVIAECIADCFSVDFLTVEDLTLKETDSGTERQDSYFHRVWSCDGLDSLIGKKVKIHYRVRSVIRKRGHFFAMVTEYPVQSLSMNFDMGRAEIRKLSAVDYFVSRRRPQFIYTPSEANANKIEVIMDDWIYPRGGVVFVWDLEDSR